MLFTNDSTIVSINDFISDWHGECFYLSRDPTVLGLPVTQQQRNDTIEKGQLRSIDDDQRRLNPLLTLGGRYRLQARHSPRQPARTRLLAQVRRTLCGCVRGKSWDASSARWAPSYLRGVQGGTKVASVFAAAPPASLTLSQRRLPLRLRY